MLFKVQPRSTEKYSCDSVQRQRRRSSQATQKQVCKLLKATTWSLIEGGLAHKQRQSGKGGVSECMEVAGRLPAIQYTLVNCTIIQLSTGCTSLQHPSFPGWCGSKGTTRKRRSKEKLAERRGEACTDITPRGSPLFHPMFPLCALKALDPEYSAPWCSMGLTTLHNSSYCTWDEFAFNDVHNKN